MADRQYRKITFELKQDEDGYPPTTRETLWAYPVEDGLFCIDSIPFFAKGISSEDVVSTEIKNGEHSFLKLERPSANTVLRLFMHAEAAVQQARDRLRSWGCESERYSANLLAVEIPESAPFGPVAEFLQREADRGELEYEVGVLRHPIPDPQP